MKTISIHPYRAYWYMGKFYEDEYLLPLTATPPSYADANEYLKKFTNDGNIEHVIGAIRCLGLEAFCCPVIAKIMDALSLEYAQTFTMRDTNKRKAIARHAQKVGMSLIGGPIKPTKGRSWRKIFVRVREYLRHELRKTPSFQDVLKYISEIYEKEHKEAKKNVKVTKSLIDKIKRENLQKQRHFPKPQINRLEKEAEMFACEQASAKTLKKLKQITGISISARDFDKILALINRSDPDQPK